MPILIITEKTSQARDLRAALGDRFGQILPAEGSLPNCSRPAIWSRVLIGGGEIAAEGLRVVIGRAQLLDRVLGLADRIKAITGELGQAPFINRRSGFANLNQRPQFSALITLRKPSA